MKAVSAGSGEEEERRRGGEEERRKNKKTRLSLISIHTRLPKVKSISRLSLLPNVCAAVTVVWRSLTLRLSALPSW